MAKKYLSIEEAARILGLEPKELNRLREKGEIRAFADRGTWKFRHDEIEELSRSLHADSDPEVPIGDYRNFGQAARTGQIELDEALSSSSEVEYVDEKGLREGDSTVVRNSPLDDRSSDSDVRLIADAKPDSGAKKGSGSIAADSGDSDSDVRLTPDLDDEDDGGSDSDVKMVEIESNTDIRLIKTPIEDPDAGSDSDVQLTTAKDSSASLSDSSVRLVSAGQETKRKPTDFDDRDSDVTLFKTPPAKTKAGGSSKKLKKAASAEEEEGAFSLDAVPLAEDGSFILGRDDSGISLAEPADSGIGLHVGDSGIELDDVDSGITLDGGDSGIALETGTSSHVLSEPQDSGIALEGDDSGITLEPDESGITQNSGDSGISLETGDSGIALDSDSGIGLEEDSSSHFSLSGDSGIALEAAAPTSKKPAAPGKAEGGKAGGGKADGAKGKPKKEDEDVEDEDDMHGTIPMMSTYEGNEDEFQETQMEVPFQTGEIEDSDFEFAEHSLDEDSEDTANVINFADDEDNDEIPLKLKKSSTEDEADLLDDAVFDVGDDESEEGSSSYAVEVAESEEELEEMEDVFGAADEDFDEGLQTGESHTDFVAPTPGRMAAPVDADWGTPMLVGLVISTVLLTITGGIAYDLVRSMWNGNDPSAPTNFVLTSLRGIFG